ncbi:MAG: C45 family autoproteolytic acyltransferase/hydrolase [Myxococcota bacterium]
MARSSLGGGPRNADSRVFALLRAVGVLAGLAFVFVALSYSGYIGFTDLDGPEVSVAPSTFTVEETGRTVRYGRSGLTRNGQIWQMHLEGSPIEIGDAHGRLASRLFGELDASMQGFIENRYGSPVEQWTASMLLRWDYRAADEFLDEERREELAALAAAVPEAGGDRMSAYQRLFLYQCMHGLAQRLEDVVLEGSMFAASTKRPGSSERGNLVIGRTLSVDTDGELDVAPIVTVVRPDGRYPYVSVGWAGLVGVVTGVNARGIFVSVNAARADEPLDDGAPLPLVLRSVLERADTLEAAAAMLQEAKLRTSAVVLVGDGVQRKSMVLELAARGREDRRTGRGEDDAVVWATNHMLKEAFEGDLQNDWVRRYTSSGYRYDRLEELLTAGGPIDPQRAADVLRDRRGLGGSVLGLGNRNALENLAITHSVIVDATAMVLWVAEGPSALGRFQAFDLRAMLGRERGPAAPLDDLAPDPLLYSESYRDYQEAVSLVKHARALLTEGYPGRALWSAKVALALAPDVGDLHRLLGDIERELGHDADAVAHYTRYLELIPGRRRDQVRVEGIIAELSG